MIFKKILHYFPPPAYLNTPYAGLSMSDAHIRVIQFESINGGMLSSSLKVKTYAALPLPAGAITAGRINNREQIITVLKQLKDKTGITHVRVSIPEEKAYLFEIEIPPVEQKEIRSAIEFKIEENVPLPADKVIFDYVTVGSEAHDGSSIHAIVSALPAKFVQIYMDLFSGAGLVPYVFEIESQAVARSLLRPIDTGTYIIMHVGTGKIGLCVVSAGVVRFTSTINPPEGWQDSPDFVISEISKVMAFWQNNRVYVNEGKKPIDRIFLSGNTVPQGIVTDMEATLKTPVVMGNVWVNAFDVNEAVPEISFSDSLQYTAAIGLALPAESLI